MVIHTSAMQPQSSSSLPFAILAPVPLVHLQSALDDNLPLVAFGSGSSSDSDAWQFFPTVDEERKNPALHVDVFIYASWSEAGQPTISKVTWRGVYTEHVDAKKERRKAQPYRPSSTAGEKGWAIYWLVKDLRPLPESQHIELSKFRGWKTKKTYSHNYLRSPLLVEHPRL